MKDFLHTGVRAAAQHKQPNDENGSVQHRQGDVLLARIPLALLDELEPEKSGEVEGKTRNEESAHETEKSVEKGNGLGDDESKDGEDGLDAEPHGPSLLALDVANRRVGKGAVHNVPTDYGAVDAAGNEDDGKCDAESDARDRRASGKKSWALDFLSDKGVDEGSGHGVDEDFDQTERPDGLDIVLGGVHLRHEAELADGE